MKPRANAAQDAALQPFKVKPRPLAGDAEKIGAAHWINLVQENLLQLLDRIRRRSKDTHAPRPCERRVRVEEKV
jgi:hypothetical protein